MIGYIVCCSECSYINLPVEAAGAGVVPKAGVVVPNKPPEAAGAVVAPEA